MTTSSSSVLPDSPDRRPYSDWHPAATNGHANSIQPDSTVAPEAIISDGGDANGKNATGGEIIASDSIGGDQVTNDAFASQPSPAPFALAGPDKLPRRSAHFEERQLAILQSSARASDMERLVVAYGGKDCRAELSRGDELLFSGPLGIEVHLDGQAQPCDSRWEHTCWISNKDVDYLELVRTLPGGITIERHLLLSRRQHFCLVADALLMQAPCQVSYRLHWPLGAGAHWLPAKETHEAWVVGPKRRALVLPLALPEWRSDPRTDRLAFADGGLSLCQSAARACALFVPLLIDLDIHGKSRKATWRHLTVAEDREVQPSDMAVGYRCQSGPGQWLIYRSLGPRGNRTVLGHNLISEFMVARFARGKTQPLVEIE